MTVTTRPSSLPEAYLHLLERHPELHAAPHHPEHRDGCLLCARARRAFGYIPTWEREATDG